MPRVSRVHVLPGFPCGLFVTLFACNQIYHKLGLACKIMLDIVGQSCVSTFAPLLQPWQTSPSPPTMVVFVTTRRDVTQVTPLSVWEVFQGVAAKDLLKISWLSESY